MGSDNPPVAATVRSEKGSIVAIQFGGYLIDAYQVSLIGVERSEDLLDHGTRPQMMDALVHERDEHTLPNTGEHGVEIYRSTEKVASGTAMFRAAARVQCESGIRLVFTPTRDWGGSLFAELIQREAKRGLKQ